VREEIFSAQEGMVGRWYPIDKAETRLDEQVLHFERRGFTPETTENAEKTFSEKPFNRRNGCR
jgi:hypothetical protein